MSQGQQFTKVSYGPEASAYGTEATSYTALPRVQSGDINSENNFIYDRGVGEGLNSSNTYYGPYNATGNVVFDVVDFEFLKHWVGSRTGSGTSGDKYALVEATEIVAGSSTSGRLVPFSIEIQNDDTETLSRFATGCVGTTFELSGSIGSKLSCTANFMAQKSGFRESGESYTPNTNPAFVMINGSWKWGTTPSALSGVRSFTLSYTNGLIGEGDETRSIESRFKGIPHLGQRGYTGTVTVILAQALADTIILNHYGLESPTNTFLPEDGSTSISPASNLKFEVDFVNNDKYGTIKVDEASIDNISIPVDIGGGLVELTFNYTAREGESNEPIEWWSV